MDVTEALKNRRTVRAFESRPLPEDTLKAFLEAALWSPSWGNTQPWEIWVATGEVLERMRAASLERTEQGVAVHMELPAPAHWPAVYTERTKALTGGRAKVEGVPVDDPDFKRRFLINNRRFFGAPCLVYLCMDRTLSNWSVFDVGMMAQSIMLAAQDHGVGSAIAANFVLYPDMVRTELGIPEGQLILIGIALGYEDVTDRVDQGFRSERRSLEDVVRFRA